MTKFRCRGRMALVATVEAELKGNFYPTEVIDSGDGLYAEVEGETSVEHMTAPLTTGQCNHCHGETTGRLRVN